MKHETCHKGDPRFHLYHVHIADSSMIGERCQNGAMTKVTKLGVTLLAGYLNSGGPIAICKDQNAWSADAPQLAAASGNRAVARLTSFPGYLLAQIQVFCMSVSVSASQVRLPVARVASSLRGVLPFARSALWPLMTRSRIRSSEEGEAKGIYKSLLS